MTFINSIDILNTIHSIAHPVVVVVVVVLVVVVVCVAARQRDGPRSL